MKKLNLGAGNDIKEGYINQDLQNLKGIDDIFNFNIYPWKYRDNEFTEIRIKDCIFCTNNLFNFMKEIHRISKPNAIIEIENVNFLSPICCQDPYLKTRIGWNTFDIFTDNKTGYYDTPTFEIISRKWIFSENKNLKWLSFIFNIFPKFYARFLYFWLPCNKIVFKLKVIEN